MAGENLYQQAQREQEARQQAFETSLASGNQDRAMRWRSPRRRSPRAASRTQLACSRCGIRTRRRGLEISWLSKHADGSTQLFVNDGWRTVVALDGRGQLAARYELDIPDEAAISFLRTGDRRRRAIAILPARPAPQQQLFVFDSQFKKLLSYPEGEHAGISDVRLADMDDDGRPDLSVGYWGVVGVQSVTLEGQRRWADRALENVFCLAVTPPVDNGHRGLLAADGRGMIVPIDDEGNDAKPISLSGRFLRWVVVADLDDDGQAECCAIASTKIGVEAAVGLSPDGDVLWTYDLPVGRRATPRSKWFPPASLTGEAGQWVLAGADGSIHILSAEGKPLEQFNMGTAISGLAVTKIDGRGALIVATDKGIDAWTLTQVARTRCRATCDQSRNNLARSQPPEAAFSYPSCHAGGPGRLRPCRRASLMIALASRKTAFPPEPMAAAYGRTVPRRPAARPWP